MRCCARHAVVFALVFAAPSAAHAQTLAMGAPPTASHAQVVDVEATVAAAVAARWGVQPADVRVEPAKSLAWPDEVSDVRLLGAGADGSWVVQYDGGHGPGSIVVRAGILSDVQVAAHDLARGTVLSASDIAARRDVRWGPPQAVPNVESGWVARRRITAGDVLDDAAVERPAAVVPGRDVRIVWQGGTVSIELSGRAAGRAAVGERVYVRASTGVRMEGTVIADGVVRVGPEGRVP